MKIQNLSAAILFTAMVAAPFLSGSALVVGEALVSETNSSDIVANISKGEAAASAVESTLLPDLKALSVYHPEMVGLGDAQHSSPPDFTNYFDTTAKKKAFYDYLLPMVHKANEEVILERQWLEAMGHQLVTGKTLSQVQLEGLSVYEARYLVHDPAEEIALRVAELLRRVDVVPASLIIAQAAKESGWGTSRFAKEGNNFFGIWCFYTGCGLTPKRRDLGRNHEVATFTSVDEGVRYYVRTINTHVAYTDLRAMRGMARTNRNTLGGVDLANGLERYSERGMAYVREVQAMIRANNMQRFNRGYLAEV